MLGLEDSFTLLSFSKSVKYGIIFVIFSLIFKTTYVCQQNKIKKVRLSYFRVERHMYKVYLVTANVGSDAHPLTA